jgi:hypothetical protein
MEQDILWLEKQEGSLNFKFGVIFAKPGQIMDDELFSNEVASNQFNQFLALLGRTLIRKQGLLLKGMYHEMNIFFFRSMKLSQVFLYVKNFLRPCYRKSQIQSFLLAPMKLLTNSDNHFFSVPILKDLIQQRFRFCIG